MGKVNRFCWKISPGYESQMTTTNPWPKHGRNGEPKGKKQTEHMEIFPVCLGKVKERIPKLAVESLRNEKRKQNSIASLSYRPNPLIMDPFPRSLAFLIVQ